MKGEWLFYTHVFLYKGINAFKDACFLHKKTPPAYAGGVFGNNELAMTYSHMGNPTLPSARRGFTSEFGKGSGGSLLLLSPAQLFMDTCLGLI